MFGLVNCQEESADPVNYGRSFIETSTTALNLDDLEGNWNAARISPYSQVTDFSLSSLKFQIKDRATCCIFGQYAFDCNQKPWNCNKTAFSIDLENTAFANPLKVSVNRIAVENFINTQELEVEFLVPVEYFKEKEEIPIFDPYKQVSIIFIREI